MGFDRLTKKRNKHWSLSLEKIKFPQFIGWFRSAIDCGQQARCGFLTSFRSGRFSRVVARSPNWSMTSPAGSGSMAWRRDVAGRPGIGGAAQPLFLSTDVHLCAEFTRLSRKKQQREARQVKRGNYVCAPCAKFLNWWRGEDFASLPRRSLVQKQPVMRGMSKCFRSIVFLGQVVQIEVGLLWSGLSVCRSVLRARPSNTFTWLPLLPTVCLGVQIFCHIHMYCVFAAFPLISETYILGPPILSHDFPPLYQLLLQNKSNQSKGMFSKYNAREAIIKDSHELSLFPK